MTRSTDRLTPWQVSKLRTLLADHGGSCRCDECNRARAELIARQPEDPQQLAE